MVDAEASEDGLIRLIRVRYLVGGRTLTIRLPTGASAVELKAHIACSENLSVENLILVSNATVLRNADAIADTDGPLLLILAAASQVELDLCPAKATARPASPSFAGCHSPFVPIFKRFLCADAGTVLAAAEELRVRIRGSNEAREQACRGAGIDHVMALAKSTDPRVQRAGLQLLASLAVNGAAESLIFRKGGVEMAMRVARETTDRDARRVAALLFFNLACCTDTRVEVALEKGGLDHIAFLADVPDPLVGSGNNVASPALYAAKALVLMASVPELRPAIARHPGAMRALLRVFSTSPNRQLRHRAAKILQQLALCAEAACVLQDCADVAARTAALMVEGVEEASEVVRNACRVLGTRFCAERWGMRSSHPVNV